MSEEEVLSILVPIGYALSVVFMVLLLVAIFPRTRDRKASDAAGGGRGGVAGRSSGGSRRTFRDREFHDADETGSLLTGAALLASDDDHRSFRSSEVTSFGGFDSGGGYSGGGSSGGGSDFGGDSGGGGCD